GGTLEKAERRSSQLNFVEWSPDDSLIAACFDNDVPKILKPGSLELKKELDLEGHKPETNTPYMAAWSPDSRHLAAVTGRDLLVVETKTLKLHGAYEVGGRPPRVARVMERLQNDPVVSRLRPACSREQQREKLQDFFERHMNDRIQSVGWARGGESVIVGTTLGAYSYNLKSMEVEMEMLAELLPGQMKACAVSPDGRNLSAMFYPDLSTLGELYWNLNSVLPVGRPVLYLWSAENGEEILQYRSSDLPLVANSQLFWGPDSQKIAWLLDNRVIIFDSKVKVATELVRSQEASIHHLAWSPDGAYIALHDSTLGVGVYDTASGAKQTSYRESVWGTFKEVDKRVFAWSRNGSAIAVGSSGSTIDIWKVSLTRS
ncbi:MAG: hypothetical protein K2Z81_07030, partial [Cyanobacteria bacterium]|nr:hypothetical protein [Cyanobacteriota bacterium]